MRAQTKEAGVTGVTDLDSGDLSSDDKALT
jgi:hypothetical protein